MSEGKNSLIRVATSEYTLMTYRVVSTIGIGLIVLFVSGTREDVRSITREFADFKLAYAERISRVEGQVGELKGSIEVHRTRIAGIEGDLRSVWRQILDMTTRQPSVRSIP